jgi:hypothetical protein
MRDELMSCITCLRVQREGDMVLVENPARDRASMSHFRICMGCASAITAALEAARWSEDERSRKITGSSIDETPAPGSDPNGAPDKDPGGDPPKAELSTTSTAAGVVAEVVVGATGASRKRK